MTLKRRVERLEVLAEERAEVEAASWADLLYYLSFDELTLLLALVERARRGEIDLLGDLGGLTDAERAVLEHLIELEQEPPTGDVIVISGSGGGWSGRTPTG